MDSPQSEKVDTRFSTPVPALQDHTAPIPIPTRNDSANNNMLHPGTANSAGYSLGESGPVARDFEQAITDDEKSADISPSPGVMHNPVVLRPIRRHVAHNPEVSRDDSSSSDRSTSPPNSIDAFAEPRRRERANTFGSRAQSEFDGLQRTTSDGTHNRRPIFDNQSVRPIGLLNEDLEARDDSPVVEEGGPRIPRIDYEAMEEFVVESRGKNADPPRKKYSFSSQGIKPDLPKILHGVSSQTALEKLESSPVRCDVSAEKQVAGGGDSEKTLNFQTVTNREDRFSFFSSEIEKTIHTDEIAGLLDPGESFRDLFEMSMEVGAWWLDVTNPTHNEMEMLQKAFGIHPLTTEDIEQKETREKVELFNTYYFVCFRSYHPSPQSEDYLEPINLYMIVFREGILSFAHTPNPHASAVRRKIGKLKNYDSLTADWICYAMVDNIVDFYFPVIRSIEVEADQIEDQVFVARAEDFSPLLRQIGECRKKVMSLMRLLGGKADVIKGFAKRCNASYSVTPRGEIGLYLSDIQDHVVTMMSNLGHFEKMLSRSHSNYLAQLSVDNLVQGNRANKVLGRITLIATIIVPLNLVCGLFGMNVPVPWGVVPGPLDVFFAIVGVMILVVVIAYVFAKRNRWV